VFARGNHGGRGPRAVPVPAARRRLDAQRRRVVREPRTTSRGPQPSSDAGYPGCARGRRCRDESGGARLGSAGRSVSSRRVRPICRALRRVGAGRLRGRKDHLDRLPLHNPARPVARRAGYCTSRRFIRTSGQSAV